MLKRGLNHPISGLHFGVIREMVEGLQTLFAGLETMEDGAVGEEKILGARGHRCIRSLGSA